MQVVSIRKKARHDPVFVCTEIAENIRQSVENQKIKFAGNSLSVTVSVGVTIMDAREAPESLINSTDKALYLAKNKGRNRVEAT